jgi:two-component system, NarL family, nitrate/nitrite response regulator NarL
MTVLQLTPASAGVAPRVAPITVLAAARQPLFREALARAMRQRARFRLVDETGEGREALHAIRRRTPDVAVVGVDLPGIDGHRVLNAVIRDGLATRVLLVGGVDDSRASYDAIAAGAAGWLSMRADERQLCDAVTAVARGEMALAPEVQQVIAAEIRRRSVDADPVLDERERRVLTLVAAGLSAEQIAQQLHVSTGTVKSSLLRLYKRFGVSERAAAVAVALRRGLID